MGQCLLDTFWRAERSKPMTNGRGRRGGRDVDRRDRKGAQVESAQAGARQAVGVASAVCGGKRSRRMVALGRRIGGGGVSAETAAVSNAAHVGHAAEPKRRTGGPVRSRWKNRRQPASGCCGVSSLERGGRDADSAAGKDRSPRPNPGSAKQASVSYGENSAQDGRRLCAPLEFKSCRQVQRPTRSRPAAQG